MPLLWGFFVAKIFVVSNSDGWYNFGTGVETMDFKSVEKAMYEDKEFLKYLPLLQEKYWKKASPKKRMKFFEELQRIINSQDDYFPSEVDMFERREEDEQTVIVTEDAVIIDEQALKKTINPYAIIETYVFEVELMNNWNLVEEDEQFVKTPKGKRIFVNGCDSITKEWSNYYSRSNPEFFAQPVTWESTKVALEFTYNLMKYMHKNYGMDSYLGGNLADSMLGSFRYEKMEKRVDENYRNMLERAKGMDAELAKLNSFFEYVNNLDYENITDKEFFGLFNQKVMNIMDEDTLCYLFSTFIRRELKGYEKLDDILSSIMIGESEEYGKFISMGNSIRIVNGYKDAFTNIAIFVANTKLSEGLCHEIEDKKFLEEANECYKYFLELMDENSEITLEYVESATSYHEYKCLMLKHYYDKIREGIKESKFYNEGIPYLNLPIYSKEEAFLSFAFNKTFDEVKNLQQEALKQQYNQKVGGKR